MIKNQASSYFTPILTSLTHDVDVSIQRLHRKATPGGLQGLDLPPLVDPWVEPPHPCHEGPMVPVLSADQVQAVAQHHGAVANQIFHLRGFQKGN